MTMADTLEIEEPRSVRWTRDQYYQIAATGLFEGRRVELIRGEIVEMSPQKSPHAAVVSHADQLLSRLFEPLGYCIRVQCPVDLGRESAPEPDLAIVTGKPLDYLDAHPTTATLILEVADTTLAYDRGDKASLYACAGIGDYWILNLLSRQLEVHRHPIPVPSQPSGWGYGEVTVLTLSDTVSPLVAPGLTLPVSALLPAKS
jgi:Uma2 family endonuclease